MAKKIKRQSFKSKWSYNEAIEEDVWQTSYGNILTEKNGREVVISELGQIRRTLAKVANQRMVRLEKAAAREPDAPYLEAGFYDKASIYLKSIGRNRFSESPSYGYSKNTRGEIEVDTYQLKNEITKLQGLLSRIDENTGERVNTASSTVAGWKQVEEKRLEKFKELGIDKNITSKKTFYKFLNSKEFDKIKKVFGSSEVVIQLFKNASEKGYRVTRVVKALNEYVKSSEVGDTGEAVKLSYKGMVESVDEEYKK